MLGEPAWLDPAMGEPPTLEEPPWFAPPVAGEPPWAELPPTAVVPPGFGLLPGAMDPPCAGFPAAAPAELDVPPVDPVFLLLLGAHPKAKNTKESPQAALAHNLER